MAHLRVHRDGAVVIGHDGMAHGQAQAAAVAFGGEVGVEDAWVVFLGDADAAIANGKH